MSQNLNFPDDAGSEATDPGDADFEQLLRTSMRARPEPAIPLDLAGKAMRLARSRQAAQLHQRAQRLARQRWWAQVTGIAATVLIGAMLAAAAHRMWTRGDITSMTASVSSSDSDSTATSTATTSSDANSSTSTSSASSTGIIASAFVGELLLIGMLLASLSRGGPPNPWAAEAVAGLY